ncbi:hypothetical protein Jiend_04430 [Micromonospora endophytica]|nr:hypothetical protein Jiend_04430 [Micromonospora endophytica]
MPYRVTISPAVPTDISRLLLIALSRPTGISSVVTKVNRLAVMTATPNMTSRSGACAVASPLA